MKKYLISGMAAIVFCGAFTSCSHDLDSGGGGTAANSLEETYEKAFITHFGEPAPTQTWGFGGSVAGTRAIDPTKPQKEDARGNMWAETWLVPDTLTDGQKLRVQKYFQYNQYPGDTHDPDLVNFFVQQVYDGHDDPLTKYDKTIVNDTLKYSTEEYLAANGSTWIQSGEHMDKLTAGSDNIHINNFNNGNCGVYPNVLDNGYVANDNGEHHHPDKIMLMLNTKTDCFGYWNSNGSNGHNDRYRLVSAEVIDEWIDSHTDLGFGPNYGDPVVDRWDRDFIGFDFDQLPDSSCYAYDNNNNYALAKMSDYPVSNVNYVWDGQKYLKIGTAPANRSANGIVELLSNETIYNWYKWNQNESFSYNNGILTFNGMQWGGFATTINSDWSRYSKLVVEFAEPTNVYSQILIQGNNLKDCTSGKGAGATSLELDFIAYDMSNVSQIAIQLGENNKTVKISRIYLVEYEYYDSQYLLANGNQIPLLYSDTNRYCGDKDNVTNDNDFIHFFDWYDNNGHVHNDGKAFDLTMIEEKVENGYLPVDTKQLREWVKIGGCADGYFSDWIVTISKANPKGDTPPPPVVVTGDSIVVIAEDLTIDDAIPDFDFNDVVFMVKWDKTANTVNVKLLAAGGTLPLYIGGTDGVFTDGVEVHAKFAEVNPDKVITTGTMINTWEGRHTEYKTPTFEVTNFNHSATTIGEVAASIKVAVKKYDALHELVAPSGQVPTKIAVKTDFVTDSHLGWCIERQDIDDKYKLIDGTPLFKNYVIGNYGDDWYQMIKDDIESTQH